MLKKIKKLSVTELHRICMNSKCANCKLKIKDPCYCVLDYLGSTAFDEHYKDILNKRIKL